MPQKFFAPKKSKAPAGPGAKFPDGDPHLWLFGLHAVRDALENPKREKVELVVTKNALAKLEPAIAAAGVTPTISDPRKFAAPLDPQSVHQGAALKTLPLEWGSVSEVCRPAGGAPLVLLLDRVTDPHNVGAILRSAEVFGARAVIAPHRHSAAESGALAKSAPGLRQLTRETCDMLAKVPAAADFASLNVSNAAAVALYAAHMRRSS